MQLENKSTTCCRKGTTPKVIQRHAGTLLLSSERCQESQGRGGGRKTTPGLKLETNRLWEQAPLPIATGHFLPLLAPCRQDLRPLPSRKGFAARSQAPPAPHRFNFISRTGGGGERGRSLLQGHSTQAPALRCLLQAWRNLYLYLTGAFQPQSRAILLGPTHTQFPFFPSAPFPPQGRASLHWNCSWLYTASASSQAELRELQACISSGNAEDWNRKKQRVRRKTGPRKARILKQVRRD